MSRVLLIFILSWPMFTSGQWIQQGNDIDGEAESDQSGWAISLNGSGSIVAIGGRYNDANGSASGHARVYELQSDSWQQIGQDIDGIEASDRFGYSISINAAGDVLAVGAPDNNSNGFESGHVRVFRLVADNWEQIGTEIIGSAWGDHAGYAISLSDDGMRLAVGAPEAIVEDGVGSNYGQVRVYENQADTWVQIGAEMIGESPEDNSGFSVSLNEDGSVVAIGAPVNSETGISAGHVRVYRDENGNWLQIGEDIDGGQDFYKSGSSISINNEGNILAIGAIDNNNTGSARVYENQSDAWVQVGADIEGEGGNDELGFSISINALGNIIAVGAPFNNGTASDAGHVRVFKNQSDAWVQVGEDLDGEALNDRSGTSVSLNAAGTVLGIGAYLNDGNGTSAGHVRVFSNSEAVGLQEDLFQANFTFYPNPSAGRINLRSNSDQEIQGYNILDLTGRVLNTSELNLKPSSSLVVDLNLPSGLYLLQLILEDGAMESAQIEIVR